MSRRPPGCVTVFVAGYKSDLGDAATHQPSNDDHHTHTHTQGFIRRFYIPSRNEIMMHHGAHRIHPASRVRPVPWFCICSVCVRACVRTNRIGARKYEPLEPHLLQGKVITDARRRRNTTATRKHARGPENPRRDERDRRKNTAAQRTGTGKHGRRVPYAEEKEATACSGSTLTALILPQVCVNLVNLGER